MRSIAILAAVALAAVVPSHVRVHHIADVEPTHVRVHHVSRDMHIERVAPIAVAGNGYQGGL